MCSCSERASRFWLFGCGTISLLFALVLGLLWPTLFLNNLYKNLVLNNGSASYANWISTPLPMYIEFHLFNWTNADQAYESGVVPHFAEMGPYVFLERHDRVALEWHPDNGTVSYNQTKTWHFVPDISNGTLDDMVTSLNVISASASYAAREMNILLRIGVNIILNTQGGSLVVTKSIRELLFDGYQDKLLDFMLEFHPSGYSLPPYTRFGWFVERNGSSEFDGRLNMFTGEKNMNHMGDAYSWNGSNRTNFYRGNCSDIRGSTGELWHPNISVPNPIEMFSTDICRTLKLDYEGPTEKHGLPGGKWVGTERVFDNGTLYPETACFCTGTVCPDLMPGVLNVSDCRFGAPAFVSYPHFYLADTSYREAIDGMSPNKSLHEFSLAMEPNTGIPIEVNARMQINVLLQPVRNLKIYTNVPTVMVPMLWFEQRAALTEELAVEAKMILMLSTLGLYIAYGFAALGAIIIVVGIFLICSKLFSSKSSELIKESSNGHSPSPIQ